jgi:hypothetical protein
VEKRVTVYVKSTWTGGGYGIDIWLDCRRLCWIYSTDLDLLLVSQPAGEPCTLDRLGEPPKDVGRPLDAEELLITMKGNRWLPEQLTEIGACVKWRTRHLQQRQRRARPTRKKGIHCGGEGVSADLIGYQKR